MTPGIYRIPDGLTVDGIIAFHEVATLAATRALGGDVGFLTIKRRFDHASNPPSTRLSLWRGFHAATSHGLLHVTRSVFGAVVSVRLTPAGRELWASRNDDNEQPKGGAA